MSDIVERLRKDAEWHHRVTGASIKWNPLSEAADEIESLRSRLAEADALLTLARNNGIDGAMGREIDAHLSRKADSATHRETDAL